MLPCLRYNEMQLGFSCSTPSCCASHRTEGLYHLPARPSALAIHVLMRVQCFIVELTSALSEEEAEKLCW